MQILATRTNKFLWENTSNNSTPSYNIILEVCIRQEGILGCKNHCKCQIRQLHLAILEYNSCFFHNSKNCENFNENENGNVLCNWNITVRPTPTLTSEPPREQALSKRAYEIRERERERERGEGSATSWPRPRSRTHTASSQTPSGPVDDRCIPWSYHTQLTAPHNSYTVHGGQQKLLKVYH